MKFTLKEIFEYLDDLTGADLLLPPTSKRVESATKKAKKALTDLKDVIADLDELDLLPIPEEDDNFPSGDEIISFFKF